MQGSEGGLRVIFQCNTETLFQFWLQVSVLIIDDDDVM